jgi:plasmid stabilization system protein ParE
MRFRLVGSAEAEVTRIILESAERFGEETAERYELLILTAFAALGEFPARPASREVEGAPGMLVYPLRLARTLVERRFRVRKPRHVEVYRVGSDGVVEILGVAHDRMPLATSMGRMFRDAEEA